MKTRYRPKPLFCLVTAVTLMSVNSALFRDSLAEDAFLASFDQQTKEAFLLQGEYVGKIKTPRDYQTAGLQIVARGGAKYVATLYQGGLPGNGWDRQNKSAWQGMNQAGLLELSAVEPDGRLLRQHAPGEQRFDVLDSQGLTVGTLNKVHRSSSTLNRPAPSNAMVLFDGTLNGTLQNAKINERGNLDVGFVTSFPVADFTMHVEFRTPFLPDKEGQQRGNSGVYIQRRYEVQILDSFGLEGKANECGGLYRQREPDLNMCLPPGQWQTYDISFKAARFDAEGNKTDKARISLRLNGVSVHDDVAIETKTGAGQPEGPDPLPTLFQNHNDAVEFRNIWLVAARRKTELQDGVLTLPLLAEGSPPICTMPCCSKAVDCRASEASCHFPAPCGASRHAGLRRSLACPGGLRQRMNALACRR